MIGIYKIENLINGKVYIGQSINILRRWNDHKSRYDNNKNQMFNTTLYKDIRNYGINNFKFSVIEECNINELNDKEIYWISYYDSFKTGYNSTTGGDSCNGGIPNKTYEIMNDLKNTKLTHQEIANKWDTSIEMVDGINTGRHWNIDIDYPIRSVNCESINRCKSCGKEIDRKATLCLDCYNSERSKNIPPKEQLLQDILCNSFVSIGKKYSVSDNAVRKWCKKYDLPYLKKDVEKLKNENV